MAFKTPADDRYFEDYVVGDAYRYGAITISQADIIEFAERFDPQPIHTSPSFAEGGPFGGIIASGIHTCAVTLRLFVEHFLTKVASLASPGMDEVRWIKPVRPGDKLSVQIEVVDRRLMRSKPDRGIVNTFVTTFTADGECVMTCRLISIIGTRATAES